MVSEDRGQGLKTLSQFLLLSLFVVLSVLLTAACVRLCRTVEQHAADNTALRTPLSYVAGKLRAGDVAGCVSVEDIDGLSVLTLTERRGDGDYNTYIWFTDGELRELYTRTEYGFDPAAGTPVAQAADFAFSVDGNMVTLTLTDAAGQTQRLRLTLRAGEGGI